MSNKNDRMLEGLISKLSTQKINQQGWAYTPDGRQRLVATREGQHSEEKVFGKVDDVQSGAWAS